MRREQILAAEVAEHALLILVPLAVALDQAQVFMLDTLATGGFDRAQKCHWFLSRLYYAFKLAQSSDLR